MSRVQEGLMPWVFESGVDRETYADPSQKPVITKVEPPKVSTSKIYWQRCLNLKRAVMTYVSRDKLAGNADSEYGRVKIQHVLDRYYGGDEKLGKSLQAARAEVDRRLEAYDETCRELGLRECNLNNLIKYLKMPNYSTRFDYFIRKHLEREDPPFEIEDLPQRDLHRPL